MPEIRLPLFDERGDSLEVVRPEEPDHFQPERGLEGWSGNPQPLVQRPLSPLKGVLRPGQAAWRA